MTCNTSASYSSGALRHLPLWTEYQHFIFVELTLLKLISFYRTGLIPSQNQGDKLKNFAKPFMHLEKYSNFAENLILYNINTAYERKKTTLRIAVDAHIDRH